MIISYRLLGSGPRKVLALHGWFGDEDFLAPALPALSDAFTFCCVAYRGYGGSLGLRGQYNLDEIAQDCLDVADSLNWSTFAVVGHSMGGKAAQKLMLLARQRVEKIVAITPVPASSVPFDASTLELFTEATRDADKRRTIIDRSTGGRLTRVWIDRLTARSIANSTPPAFAGYFKAWAQSDFSAEVADASTPLLALVGEHDPQLNKETMRATYLKWFTNSSVEVLNNAGHYPIDETPIACATAMQRFLDYRG